MNAAVELSNLLILFRNNRSCPTLMKKSSEIRVCTYLLWIFINFTYSNGRMDTYLYKKNGFRKNEFLSVFPAFGNTNTYPSKTQIPEKRTFVNFFYFWKNWHISVHKTSVFWTNGRTFVRKTFKNGFQVN